MTSVQWLTWAVCGVAAAAVLVVAWALLTGWSAIVHGYPLYGPLLLITALVAIFVGARTLRSRPAGRRRPALRVILILLALVWVGVMGWLRPFTATEPALSAMDSDAAVRVRESPTRIEFIPTTARKHTSVFFQPGAKVDARAYAATLRPLAEAGYPVIIAKQPLNIAFLALPAFDAAKSAHPDVGRWVVGGHSLGGTVAAIQAAAGDTDPQAPVVGLLFYASYPANDLSTALRAEVLSLSGSADGLATVAKINASKADLPGDTTFTVIDGAVHAFFGDYGPQPGDGTPTISHDRARTEITEASLRFVAAR
ncbi:MAG TPA: alpha/beta hydrolase [Microlunatus sp.]